MPDISLDDLKVMVADAWNKKPENSFKGTFTTFGEPFVQAGDVINLYIDNGFGSYISQNYYVDTVILNINENEGFTQEITIGSKIS